MNCPKCSTPNMFDNRESKKNPKAPDYKCRDRSCDGVIWPPKKGEPGYGTPAPRAATTQQRAPVTLGRPIPGMDDTEELPPIEEAYEGNGEPSAAAVKVASLFRMHSVCFTQAMELATRAEVHMGLKADLSAISALTAQLFIAAKDRGVLG